jgi:hypothetical protein
MLTVSDYRPTDRPTVSLVEEMREEVVFLREELPRERDARVEEKRPHDAIVPQLAQRIPELEAHRETAPEVREGHETASPQFDRGTSPKTLRSPHSAARGCIGSSSGRKKRSEEPREPWHDLTV